MAESFKEFSPFAAVIRRHLGAPGPRHPGRTGGGGCGRGAHVACGVVHCGRGGCRPCAGDSGPVQLFPAQHRGAPLRHPADGGPLRRAGLHPRGHLPDPRKPAGVVLPAHRAARPGGVVALPQRGHPQPHRLRHRGPRQPLPAGALPGGGRSAGLFPGLFPARRLRRRHRRNERAAARAGGHRRFGGGRTGRGGRRPRDRRPLGRPARASGGRSAGACGNHPVRGCHGTPRPHGPKPVGSDCRRAADGLHPGRGNSGGEPALRGRRAGGPLRGQRPGRGRAPFRGGTGADRACGDGFV